MTEKGKQMHAFWYACVAIHVVLGKMTRKKAEEKAYKELLELYDEETIKKELEIDKL